MQNLETTVNALIVRSQQRLCAVPLAHVVEVMRPLPIESPAALAPSVLGLAVIRGVPVPVVDLGKLLGGSSAAALTRFVTLRIEQRIVALGVEAIVGIRALNTASLDELAPLLREANTETIAAIGTLDEKLLFVLRAARLIPDDLWSALENRGGA